MLEIEMDESVGAAYIRLSENPVDHTVELEPDSVLMDVDANGDLVGIEVLGPMSKRIPQLLAEIRKLLGKAEKVSGRELAVA